MATRMQQRRGTAAQWISTNDGNGPILSIGEIGFESDNNRFKIGDGVNHWVDLPYFSDNQSLTDLIDGAPDLLNTLGELANALGDDADFVGTVSAHTSATTSVHGIADTSELATKTYVTDAVDNATVDQSALAGDGISWNGVTEQFDVDNTVARSSDIQELAQDAIGNAAGSGLSYNDSTGAISVDTSVIQAKVSGVSNTEIGYLDGVTSAIQTQIDSKAPTANPTFTGTVAGVTKAMVGLGNVNNTSDADKPVSTNTQLALDLKANAESPSFTGTVSGVTKAHVGLGNVDNTSDANKPVSTATQTALDLKAPKASPTFTGTATASDLIVNGDFTVNGTNFSASATSITIEDNMVQLAHQNPGNTVDLGLVVGYTDGVSAKHAGVVRDVSANAWKFFKNVTTEPSTTVDFTQGELDDVYVGALQATSAVIGGVNNTEIQYLNGVTSAIQDQLDDKLESATAASTYAPIDSPTFTGTVAGITKSMVGLSNVDNTTDANKPISTSTQGALDLKAPLANPTFTGTVTLPTGTVTSGMIANGTIVNEDINASAAIAWTKIAPSSTVSAEELGYLDGVTSAIQTQIDAKLSSADATSTYQQKVANVSDTEISYLDGVTGAIQTQIDAKAPINSPTFTGTVSGVTKSMVGLSNVDNTTDANKPVSSATQTALDLKAPIASPTFTGTVAGITKSMVGLGSVDNTSDANKPVSTAAQTALDLKAPLNSPTFTGTVTLPANTISQSMMSDDSVGTNEIGGLAVTTEKLAAGAVTNAKVSESAAIDWTKLAISSTVSATEAGYLDGVTSAIQTQIDAKAPKAAPTFTGTLTAADVTISGNLTVSGTTTTVNTTNFTTSDPVIYLGEGNNANLVDIGFVGSYNDGTYAHQGLVKDTSDSKWKLFKGVTDEPTTTVNFAQGSLDALAVGAFEASSATIGNVSNTELQYLDGVTSAIQTQINAKAPTASPTFTGTVTIPSGAALGTPASATLTNATGLPVATGISGLGTGVATFLATPSSANFAAAITDEIGTGNVVLSDLATNPQSGGTYTLVLADKSKLVEVSNGSANAVTIPLNSSVAFPVGTQITILQTGAGTSQVNVAAGVTLNATPQGTANVAKFRAQWSSITLIKRATDTWVAIGDITA